MKSPADFAPALRRQWLDSGRRVQQLLNAPNAWPIRLAIPWPSAAQIEGDLNAVRQHVQTWRAVKIGQVVWEARSHRGTGQALQWPRSWLLTNADEWVAAMQDREIAREYQRLLRWLAHPDVAMNPAWCELLIRQRHLLASSSDDDVKRAIGLAARLAPGCAQGLPLRAMPFADVDSKLWERQRTLLSLLLEARHPGQVASVGLEAFLGADSSGAHWLDVVDLDGSLLPWPPLRVRADDLARQPPPGRTLLLVENHQCLHHQPERGSLPGTVAVLGSGLDLAWLNAPWLRQRRVGYWGDIDTWGLTMLARARVAVPTLTALLMDEGTWRAHVAQAVAEPMPAPAAPIGLTGDEQALFGLLRDHPERGRLEQERLPVALVRAAITAWALAVRI